MDNQFISPVSVEKFAAYLDGNLSESEMQEVETFIAHNDGLEDMASMSDIIEEDIQSYLQDEFVYESDMTMFDESSIEIPQLDIVDESGEQYVACEEVETDDLDSDLVVADTIDDDPLLDIIESDWEDSDLDTLSQKQDDVQNEDTIISDENNMDFQNLNIFSPDDC